MQRRPERISSLNVERGMYVLRYVSSAASDNPVIYVRSSPGDEASVKLVPYPGDSAGCLSVVGSLMVVAAEQLCTLQVTAQATSPTGSLNAELQLEPLKGVQAGLRDAAARGGASSGQAVPAAQVAAVQSGVQPALPVQASMQSGNEAGLASASQVAVEDLRMLAHVARRGDVVVSEGVWIAGPEAPAPIEGLAIKCPAALGELRYQVLASGESQWSEWLPESAFAGSRGRAKTLVGVRLQLVPAMGANVRMEGEALFLGSAVMRRDGLEMEFRSAAGFDPLLGLRLALRREAAVGEPMPKVGPEDSSAGRVRVFRASGRRSG